MNELEILRERIHLEFPQAKLGMDAPLHKNGVWNLDVELGGKPLIVDWSPKRGFGLSDATSETYTWKPDEVICSLDETWQRIRAYLSTREQPAPVFAVLLSRLREKLGITQQELARRIGVRQATISGIERRDDLQVSTLRRIIGALGGALEIYALFPSANYRIQLTDESNEKASNVSLNYVLRDRKVEYKDAPFRRLKENGTLPEAWVIARTVRSNGILVDVP